LNEQQKLLCDKFITTRKSYARNNDENLEEELINLEELMGKMRFSEKAINEIGKLCDRIVKIKNYKVAIEQRNTKLELNKKNIKNCLNLNSLSISNNSLINLEFVKNLNGLIGLEIDGNERILSGVEYFPDSLEEFSCEGTELFNILEQHEGD